MTADGVLIAFHDDRLERVTDRIGVVAETPWSELKTARVGGTEPILRFDELLEALPDLRINVEPKHDAAVEPLISAIRRSGSIERLCIGSFSDRRLAVVRSALGSAACTSLGTREVAALRAAASGLPFFRRWVERRSGRCVQIPTHAHGINLVTPRLLRLAHEMRLPVHVWTVNAEDEMRRLLDLGVDGLMSDHPRVLREVLAARAAWSGTTAG